MLERKYRKMPKNFEDYTKRYGWKPENALSVLGKQKDIRELPRLIPQQAQQRLKELAFDYLKWFKKEPEKTHIFPLTATVLQFEFAKGVRDGFGLKIRLRTIAQIYLQPFKLINQENLNKSIKKLGLKKTGVVMHDYVSQEQRLTKAFKQLGLKDLKTHLLDETQDLFEGTGYLPKEKKSIPIKSNMLIVKRQDAKTGKTQLIPGAPYTEKQVAFIKRSVYAAGVAAARELLKSKDARNFL